MSRQVRRTDVKTCLNSALFVGALLVTQLYVAAQTSQTVTKTYSYSGSAVSIPLSGTGVSAVAEIYIPDNLIISSVSLQVQITYPAVGDLKASLFSANGTRTVLVSNSCGKLANINTTFDDTAQSKFSDFCPVEPGRRSEEHTSELQSQFHLVCRL